jgi:beta-phosphoglucomutase-like phosphatase (HAD superfamily)
MPKHFDPLPQAILFDCDGTLLLTSDLHYQAISTAAAQQGFSMPRDWYMAQTGLGRRDLFAKFAVDFSVDIDVQRITADSVAMTVAMAAQARENPSVAAIARHAAGRMPIAVVTNCEAAIAKAFLIQASLHDLFDCIITCEDAAHPKPAPDLYLEAAARLGVVKEQCVVLEDSDQGIEAAIAAGMSWFDVRSADWPRNCEGFLAQLVGLPFAEPTFRRMPPV